MELTFWAGVVVGVCAMLVAMGILGLVLLVVVGRTAMTDDEDPPPGC